MSGLSCTLAFTRYCYYQYCMVYGIHTRGRRGGRILPNSRAVILHQGRQCRWARKMTGWLIRAQKPQSKTISCKGHVVPLFVLGLRVNPTLLPMFKLVRRRWLQDTSKRKLADFLIFFASPPSCFPGLSRGWPDNGSKQALRIKQIGLIELFSRVCPKKGKHAPGK